MLPNMRVSWEATWWVEFLQKFGPTFPSPDASHDAWNHFIIQCSAVPISVVAIGLLVSISLLCSACCGCCVGSRASCRRRSSVPTAAMALLTLVLIAVGTIIYWTTGSQAGATAIEQLNRAADDAGTAAALGSQLESAGNLMLADLDALVPSCPVQYQTLAQQFVATVRPQIESFSQQSQSFVSTLGPIPQAILSVKDKSSSVTLVAMIGLLIPLGLVVLGCLVLVLAVCMSHTGRCTGPCIRCLAPVFFVPTVLIIAVAAATQLELGIAISSFCVNVDSNSLALIDHFGPQVTYELANYYIAGVGTNPLLQDLSDAEDQITKAKQSIVAAQPFVDNCPNWGKYQEVLGALNSTEVSISRGNELLSTGNIYPYYEQAVREDICSTVVIGLGWLSLFQVLAGIVCLPFMTCLANTYLKEQAASRRSEATRPLTSYA